MSTTAFHSPAPSLSIQVARLGPPRQLGRAASPRRSVAIRIESRPRWTPQEFPATDRRRSGRIAHIRSKVVQHAWPPTLDHRLPDRSSKRRSAHRCPTSASSSASEGDGRLRTCPANIDHHVQLSFYRHTSAVVDSPRKARETPITNTDPW